MSAMPEVLPEPFSEKNIDGSPIVNTPSTATRFFGSSKKKESGRSASVSFAAPVTPKTPAKREDRDRSYDHVEYQVSPDD